MADYDPLEQIRRKCEQYWNENHVGAEELHAILDFIHVRTGEVGREIKGLHADGMEAEKGYPGRLTLSAALKAERADGMEAAAVIHPKPKAKLAPAAKDVWDAAVFAYQDAIRSAAKEQADGK